MFLASILNSTNMYQNLYDIIIIAGIMLQYIYLEGEKKTTTLVIIFIML